MHFVLLKENKSKEDIMAQNLELVLKRNLVSEWWHAIERVMFFEKASAKREERPKEKTEKADWRDKLVKNGY